MVYKTSKDTQERKDAKRQYIIDTAIKVFAREGYHKTSVKDIVDEAGISVGSFYFYFKGKEDLFAELYDEMTGLLSQVSLNAVDTTKDNTQQCSSIAAKRFARGTAASLWAFQKSRALSRIMLIEAIGVNPEYEKRRSENLREDYLKMEKLFIELKDKKVISIPDPKVTAIAYESSGYYLIMEWLAGDGEDDLTDYSYPLAVFRLQALKIDYSEEEVKEWINEVLIELDNGSICKGLL
ncbi:MAG: TetR/AcrR family transcriptional regulator [Bacillota bacterium]|nr:TetR/AcrR family transcriptional regulator [Bacillota bacterium]